MRAARPLFLHHSALSPDEYAAFTLWLAELLPPPTTSGHPSSSARSATPSSSDQDDLEAQIRVDDVGRFLLETLHVQEEVWEDVLSIFHPNHRSLQPRNSISQSHLRALPPLRGGEVFAVFRLVGHAIAGSPVHIEGKRLVFWQAAPPLPTSETANPTAKPYPPQRTTARLPPPPQHLGRKPSTTSNPSSIGHRSTSSLSSKPRETTAFSQPPLPVNANPFRRGSQPSPNLPSPSKGGYPSSDSDGLRKVGEDVLTVDSSASSSSDDDGPAGGRNHCRWQTPVGGRDESDSKHSGDGVRPRSRSKSGGAQSSEPFLSVSTSSSALSPQVAAKLGLSPRQAGSGSTNGKPATPLTMSNRLSPSSVTPLAINVVPSPSSNPFRTRLDSASGTALSSLPDQSSPLSPPLPPRPSPASVIASTHRSSSHPSSNAPPLPPRETATLSSARASAGGSSIMSDQTSSVHSSPTKARPVPPAKPPKPNSFHTTPLIQQSLLAAKGARKQEEKNVVHERKFEVIGSSSSSGVRTGRSGSIAGGSGSGTDPLGISPVTTGSVAGGSKFSTVNSSFGGGGSSRHRSHSLALSGGGSPFRSPPIIATAKPEREYPFPTASALPPPSTVVLNSHASSGKPPPPPRRNSVQPIKGPPPPPPPSSSTLLARHASMSSGRSRVSSGDPIKDGLRAMEQGVGWLKDSAASAAAAGRGRGRAGERERLVASDEEEVVDDSGDERRRERRREMEREGEASSWKRLA